MTPKKIHKCLKIDLYKSVTITEKKKLIHTDLSGQVGADFVLFQRLHAPRGEGGHGEDGRTPPHEHLPPPGDQQNAEGHLMLNCKEVEDDQM